METTIFLARAIGLFGVISTLAIILRYEKFLEIEKSIAKNITTIYLSGFLIVMTGALLVAGHNIWIWDWPVMITLLGWVALLKGLLRIFFPDTVVMLINKKRNNRWFLMAEISFFIFSAYLVYRGFFTM